MPGPPSWGCLGCGVRVDGPGMEPATCAHLGHLRTIPARSGTRTGCCRTSGKAAGTTVSTRDLQEHRPAPTGNDAEQHAASPQPRWLVRTHGDVARRTRTLGG